MGGGERGEGDRVEREGRSDRVKSGVGGGAQEVHCAMVYLPVCSITILQFTNGMGLRIPFNFSENFFFFFVKVEEAHVP